MPDATRPTRSRLFQAVKSVLSLDGSLKRIVDHPGSKNFNIIFAYATALAYDRSMHKKGPNGVTGLEVLNRHKDGWITPKRWLEEMSWGLVDGQLTPYSHFIVNLLFNSFMQDGVLKVKGDFPQTEFQFIQELDYPTQEQIDAARKTNKYFMMAMEDLIDKLPVTLEHGKPQASRSKSTWLPLWEALLGDALVDVFRDEMLLQFKANLPKLNNGHKELNIVEIATGTGSATVQLMEHLIANYNDLTINFFCYEEVHNLLTRAKERISVIDKELKDEYKNKNLVFNFQFESKKYSEPISLDKDSIDIIVSFQNLHYLNNESRIKHFKNLNRIIREDGVVIVAQTTSYSDDFPHPMSLAYVSVEGFEGYPTVKHVKEDLGETFFGSVKSSALDSIWVMRKPKL